MIYAPIYKKSKTAIEHHCIHPKQNTAHVKCPEFFHLISFIRMNPFQNRIFMRNWLASEGSDFNCRGYIMGICVMEGGCCKSIIGFPLDSSIHR